MVDAPQAAFRRILVGLDASQASLAAVEAAAALARRVGADLAGLFVEDEDVLRLAALSFGVIRIPSGAREGLDPATAAAEQRALAARARETLERAASGQRVGCTFTVVRGQVVAEVLAAADRADLLVLGTGGHRRSGRARVGETARTAAAHARPPVLLLRRGARLGEPVVAVDDGGPAGGRALEIARALSERGGPVVVEAGGADPATLARAVARLSPAVIVVPAGGVHGGGEGLDALLSTGAAALLVR